jgi:hypothetical protein
MQKKKKKRQQKQTPATQHTKHKTEKRAISTEIIKSARQDSKQEQKHYSASKY